MLRFYHVPFQHDSGALTKYSFVTRNSIFFITHECPVRSHKMLFSIQKAPSDDLVIGAGGVSHRVSDNGMKSVPELYLLTPNTIQQYSQYLTATVEQLIAMYIMF